MPPAPEALVTAVQQGDAAAVSLWLARNPELAGARTAQGLSLVMLALYYQHPEVARIFVEQGAPLDLHEAAAAGAVERVRELLDAEPGQVNRPAADGFPALGLACFFGHRDVVRLLIDRGADVNQAAENALRVAPAHAAAARRDAVTLAMLLAAGANPNAVQQKGFTPLHTAASEGQRAMVELLLSHGADPRIRCADGRLPEDLAREKGHDAVADILEEERLLRPNE